MARRWVEKFARLGYKEEIYERLAGKMTYYRMDFTDESAYVDLDAFYRRMGDVEHIFYFAVAPRFFEIIVKGLQLVSGAGNGKVVIEKPFGENLLAAASLNATMETCLLYTSGYSGSTYSDMPINHKVFLAQFDACLLYTSDLTKIITILFFAKFLMEREQAINNKKTIIQAAALILPSLILIYKQPNLSNTICLATVFCIMLYMGGLSYKFIGTVLAITIPTAALFLTIVVQPNQPFLKDYQQARILAWLEPEKYATDEAYQQINSVMAVSYTHLPSAVKTIL